MYSSPYIPAPPHQFRGKWHHKTYRVLREIGRGANGTVYLAVHGAQTVALKIAADPMDLLMEVNMLRSVQKHKGSNVGPLLFDVDDIEISGKSYTYYCMEYLSGERVDQYIKRVGREWTPIVIVQLLSRLQTLHQEGWVFGDLKPENLIMVKDEKTLRLIDFGGVTKQGKAVRQFTDDYDRAAWQAGDRRADARYDLFACAITMIRLLLAEEQWKRIKQGTRQVQVLCDIIRANDQLRPFHAPLVKALTGQYHHAEQMKNELMAVTVRLQGKREGRRGTGHWLGITVITVLLLSAGLGYLYVAWM